MKHCPRCNEDLDLSAFGICRQRADGLNLYCKVCIREKVTAFRLAKREYNKTRACNNLPVQRKSSRRVRPIWLLGLEPREAVELAMKRGAATQKEIRHATRLAIDTLTDAIADLYVEGKLDRSALKERRYVAA